MTQPEKKEDYLSIHNKRHKYAKIFTDTHEFHVMDGYHEALKKHLMPNGELDYDLLDDSKIQTQFIKTMTDFYKKKAEEKAGTIAKDDFHADILMKAYMGVTKTHLQGVISQYGSKLDYDLFGRVKNEFNKEVKDQLYSTATGHITEDDLSAITKKLGLEGRLISPLTLDEAKTILNTWKDNDETITETALRQFIGKKLKKR